MSQIFLDIGTKSEFPLELHTGFHGTDGRLELPLDTETRFFDDPQEIGYFRNRLKDFEESLSSVAIIGLGLFMGSIISLSSIKRLVKFEQTVSLQPQLQTFAIDPEVKEILKTDEYSRKIIDNVLLEIQKTPELRNENYYINVSIEQDIEVPEWKEIAVSVKVKKSDHDAKMRLWEKIEENVRAKIQQIRENYPLKEVEIIDKINENLAIEIDEIF